MVRILQADPSASLLILDSFPFSRCGPTLGHLSRHDAFYKGGRIGRSQTVGPQCLWCYFLPMDPSASDLNSLTLGLLFWAVSLPGMSF